MHKLSRRSVTQVELTIDDAASAAVVLQLAQSAKPAQVRLALNLLHEADHVDYRSTVLRLLHHGDPAIQMEAVHQLKQNPMPEATASLASLISDDVPRPELRSGALLAYLGAGGANGIDVAISALNDRHRAVQCSALVGLLQHGGLAGHVAAGQRLLALADSDTIEDQLLLAETLATLEKHNFYQPLSRLLTSSSFSVRRFALQAAAKTQQATLLPDIVAQLEVSPVRAEAVDTLRAYGRAVLPFVERALSPNDVSLASRLHLIRLSGLLPDGANHRLLLPQLGHRNLLVRAAVLAALERSDFRAELSDEITVVDVAIDNEMTHAVRLLVILSAIEHLPEFPWLIGAINTEFKQTRERLLRLFSFYYNKQALRRVGDYLVVSRGDELAQAIETVDVMFSTAHKRLLLPLIDNDLTTKQTLSALSSKYPIASATPEEWLQIIISDSDAIFEDWTRACAVYESTQYDRYRWVSHTAEVRSDQPLTAETLDWMYKGNAEGVTPMLTIEKISFLKDTDIFQAVPEAVLASVARIMSIVELPADRSFIREGELGDEMFIIVEGAVQVVKNNRPLIKLEAGETVGELTVFDPEPRSADVITLEPTILLQLEKDTLREVMADRPEISAGIIQALSRRIREQGQLMAS